MRWNYVVMFFDSISTVTQQKNDNFCFQHPKLTNVFFENFSATAQEAVLSLFTLGSPNNSKDSSRFNYF